MGRYKIEEKEKYKISYTAKKSESNVIQGAREIKNNIVRERLHSKCEYRKECFKCLSNKEPCPGGRI